MKKDIFNLNKKIKDRNNIFLFGAHIFSQMLIFNGLNLNSVKNVLDNDKKKQNQYLYGTNIKVIDPTSLKKIKNPIIILRAAQYSKEIKELILKKINSSTKFL